MKDHSFAFVTEMPGNRVTPEQLNMIACRYAWAADLVEGLDVLEVACGPGLGLGHLASRARRVTGGDYDAECLRISGTHYRERLPITRFDAQSLPYTTAQFDAVIMFEAIYYLSDVNVFLSECRRVLRPGGMLLLTLPNRDWPGFSRSPQSYHYFSPPELAALGNRHGFAVEVHGTYRQDGITLRQQILGVIRRTVTKLGLVPTGRARTEAIRRFLKKWMYGRLEVLPHEVGPELANGCQRKPLSMDQPDRVHRVFYVRARLEPPAPRPGPPHRLN